MDNEGDKLRKILDEEVLGVWEQMTGNHDEKDLEERVYNTAKLEGMLEMAKRIQKRVYGEPTEEVIQERKVKLRRIIDEMQEGESKHD